MVADMVDEGTVGMAEGAPTTARLREVLDRSVRVVIVEAPPHEADRTDAPRIVVTGAEIADLARFLAIVDGGNGDRCRCYGWPTITAYGANGEPTARWTLHHQSGVRGIGDCDADLRDGPALTAWLAERGLTRSREVQAELAVMDAEEERRRMRWVRAAPAGLTDAAMEMARPPGRDEEAWSNHVDEAEGRIGALARHLHTDGTERVRALLAWAGIPSRETTSGLMWYDMAVQRLLLAEAPELLLAAFAAGAPSAAQLDGAAALFSSLEWTKAHGRQLPEPVKSMLIAHIRESGTDPMRFRMQHGYYGAERSV